MKLLEPITVGGVIFKNRLMFPPLTTRYEGGVGYIVLDDVTHAKFHAYPEAV